MTALRCRLLVPAIATMVLCGSASGPRAQQLAPMDAATTSGVVLAPTEHPRLPRDLSQLWMAPDVSRSSMPATASRFTEAVKLEVDANFARALPIFADPAMQQGVLGEYAIYYKGLAELRTGRNGDAQRTFSALRQQHPTGYLAEASALREAEADEALGDEAAAVAVLDELSKTLTSAPDEVLLRLARSAKQTGDLERAAAAYARIYYEFPTSDISPIAGGELDALPNVEPIGRGGRRFKLELGRAERLFGGRHYAEARQGFDALRSTADGDDKELVRLRLAECDYFLKRPRNARDGVRPYIDHASRQGEALFFYAIATRELGDRSGYLSTIHRIVTEFPTDAWAEEALNHLASRHIIEGDDEDADTVLRDMYARFPKGRYAERAAWKIGWYAFRAMGYAEAARYFEGAAANFPRSDYRPMWLYWSGRAHAALDEPALAEARYTLVATDYLNTYYGRLAVQRLNGQAPQRRLVVDVKTESTADVVPLPATTLPPNEPVIRALLSLDLYDQAIDELRYAQKVWGDSPAIQATFGWIFHARGDLRAGINAMKRAYPQYMAAGGERLPIEILRILFPVEYWPQIQQFATENHLDPFVMAALILQESNFEAAVKSPANAYGLMQLLPSTGRRYAKAISRKYALSLLTTAEPNLRMGMRYFADLVNEFGGVHFALASYNAGPNRVVRWKADAPGAERDEFIDSIPFPETQNYVKRILGTAEDYRRVYSPEAVASSSIEEPIAPRRSAKPDAEAPVSKTAAKPSASKSSSKKKPARKPATVAPASTRPTTAPPSKKKPSPARPRARQSA